MRKSSQIAVAVADLLGPEVVRDISVHLVSLARSGDPPAIHGILELLSEYGALDCDHPPDSRQNLTMMGGGPLREKCGLCGANMIEGVEVK